MNIREELSTAAKSIEDELRHLEVNATQLLDVTDESDREAILGALARVFLKQGWIMAAAKCAGEIHNIHKREEVERCVRQ